MALKPKKDTLIEWAKTTWNPTSGCTKVKGCADCMNCYAEKVAMDLQARGKPSYKDGFKPTIQGHRLKQPFGYEKPSIIFVNSMSDLFHEDFPVSYLKSVFEVMNKCSHHQFLILTKRPERALELSSEFIWSENIWMGTSVGTNGRIPQIEFLKQIPARIKFISYEPLLTKLVDHNLEGIDWAILGGESPGIHGMRPSSLESFTSLIDICDRDGVAIFVKQLGGRLGWEYGMMKNGKPDMKGGDYSKFPEILKRREFPIDVSKYL